MLIVDCSGHCFSDLAQEVRIGKHTMCDCSGAFHEVSNTIRGAVAPKLKTTDIVLDIGIDPL